MELILKLDHHNALRTAAANYSVRDLRVPPDFPISITEDGSVLSRFSDNTWDLTPYSIHINKIYFDLQKTGDATREILEANKDLLKKIAVWLLYAAPRRFSASTLVSAMNCVKTLAVFCCRHGTTLSTLRLRPEALRELPAAIPPSSWASTKAFLIRLRNDSDSIGFKVLDYDQIASLDQAIERYEADQTPFIPDRIYQNVIDRCASIISEFLANEDSVRQIFRLVTDISVRARHEFPTKKFAAITTVTEGSKRRNIGAIEYYTGSDFDQLLHDHRVDHLIHNLVDVGDFRVSPRHLSHYASAVQVATRIMLTALSGMRVSEVGSLDYDCLEVREDPELGKVYLLKGRTTKTLLDDHAYWVTSPLAALAVSAAQALSEIRSAAMSFHPVFAKHGAGVRSRKLYGRVADPWIGTKADTIKSVASNPKVGKKGALLQLLDLYSRILDSDSLKIHEEDLAQALRLTPDLCPQRFAVGNIWPLGWHQFRRTLVCRALGAGISLPALAWQLKHAGIAMTSYYGNNYFQLRVDEGLRKEFELAQLEMLLVQGLDLAKDHFVAMNGVGKRSFVQFLSQGDAKKIREAAKLGQVAFKRTALGVCTNPEPCTYGGWEYISKCASCGNALVDKRNAPRLRRMVQIIEADLATCNPSDFLLRESLMAQKTVAEEVLHATE